MKTILFLTGSSGSGKGYFKNNILPKPFFYPLISMTTRKIMEGEVGEVDYYFRSEKDFKETNFVTYLDVNQAVRKAGEEKHLYGVSVKEFLENHDKNLAYDVIEPKYIRQMIDWCGKMGLKYDFKILYFLPQKSANETIKSRVNMVHDEIVRKTNTSNKTDFDAVNLSPDWYIISSKEEMTYDKSLLDFFEKLNDSEKPLLFDPRIKLIENSAKYFKDIIP